MSLHCWIGIPVINNQATDETYIAQLHQVRNILEKEKTEMEESKREELKAHAIAMEHTTAIVRSMIFKFAIDMGIAEIIHKHEHPIPLSQLAASLPKPCTKLDVLGRIMRCLVNMKLFTVTEGATNEKEESYGPTLASKFLLMDDEKSVASMFYLVTEKKSVEAWEAMGLFLEEMECKSVFEAKHGEPLWAYASKAPELNHVFNKAMAGAACMTTTAVVEGCGDMFQGIRSLVDVGGGTGTASKIIAKAFSHVHCTVLDLPHVVEKLPDYPGLKFVAGNMFSFVPKADAVMLMAVLHDWGDEDCLKILKKCKEAVNEEGGKVIIVDIVLGINNGEDELDNVRFALDMLMLINTGGKERTEKDWKQLLTSAGFTQWKIRPIKAMQCVIEARS